MFYHNKFISWLLGLVICLLLSTSFMACTGDSGDSLVASGGIGGTGITIGAVSGFGSIFVNNGEINTSTVEVIIEGDLVGVGDEALRDFLEIGMVVRVESRIWEDGTAKAERIVFNDNVEGPVQSITPINGFTKSIILMGQTVIVDDLTVFKNTSIDLIVADNMLEASGFLDSDGFIRATFVEKMADAFLPDNEVELKGKISNVDILQKTFQINLLTIDYSLADVGNLPGGMPSDGQLLEVKGTLDENLVLTASQIDLEDELSVENADAADIQGIVTDFSSLSELTIGNISIQTDAITSFEGLNPEDVSIGSTLLVKGSVNNRVLLADRVIAKEKVKLKSYVTGINLGENTISLAGLNALVKVNSLTKFLGIADSLEQIESGDDARIFGRSVAEDEVLASKVMVKSSVDDKVVLKGPVTSVLQSSSTLIILGTSVDTSTVPDDGFELSDGTPITREEFFDTVRAGDVVNAKGTISGIDVTWTGIELQTED
jgi:hypothetical protein